MGKKKAVDVQFYTEVMESVQTIDAGRRSMYDPDELEEEQRERDTKNRVRLSSCFPPHTLSKGCIRFHRLSQLSYLCSFML